MDYLQEFKKELKGFRAQRTFKEDIEPEEIFLDAQKTSEYPEQRFEIPIKRKVFITFFGMIILGLAILAGTAGYFQFFKDETFSTLASRNSFRAYPILAPRGLIYDKNFKVLANNLPSYDIFLLPQDLPKSKEDRETLIEQLAYLLDLKPKEINKQLDDFDFEKEQRMLLASNLETEKILALQSRLLEFQGVAVEKGVVRQYPFGENLSHVLGYTGRLTKENVENYPDYFLTERIGKSGLETQYEEFLRGEPGEHRVEVDARGRQIKEVGVKEPLAGKNIVTSIDLDLQKKMQEEVSKMLGQLKLKKAAAVAMNPKNGNILAMVSMPSFDNNIFEQETTDKNIFASLWEDKDQPMFNRVISGQYPAGSTIKPVMGVAALQEKVVTPQTTVHCTGELTIVNQYDPGVVYRFPDWKAHGTINLYSAIAQSSNVYFYTVGGGYGSINGLGIGRIKKYFELFGLGALTGIDLPGEKTGLLPDPEWKEKNKDENWFVGDTYHVSIGQGDFLATPLQMVSAISAVANGGKLLSPRLVDKIVDSDKNSIKVFEPRLIRQDFAAAKNFEAVRQGMREAVVSGSARFLNDLPVKAAGKTGTAQVAGQEHENAWFVGFAPYDDPEIVLAIMLENAGEGSSFAVPVAKEILKYYFSK